MFEQTDFFQEYDEDATARFDGLGRVGRIVGKWLGFATIFTVLAFTAYHGINATWSYQGHTLAGRITGTVGILSVELVLFSLILKWHNRGITGPQQRVAALLTFAVGLVLIFLAVITDSRLNAGLPLTAELAFYLQWILPVSPVLLAVLNHIVDELDPAQLWGQQQAEEERQLGEMRFRAAIAGQRAELEARKAIVNANLNARVSAARQIAAHYQSDTVQTAIRQSALGNVPSQLPASLEAVIDASVKGGRDLAPVRQWCQLALAQLVAQGQRHPHRRVPQALQDRLPATLQRPAATSAAHWLDTLMAALEEHMAAYTDQVEKLAARACPPLPLFRHGEAWLEPGKALRVAYSRALRTALAGREIEALTDTEREAVFAGARQATEAVLVRYPEAGRPRLLLVTAAYLYAQGGGSDRAVPDGLLWQLGAPRPGQGRAPGVAQQMLVALRQIGLLQTVVPTTVGPVWYDGRAAPLPPAGIPVRLSATWFNWLLATDGRSYARLGDVPPPLRDRAKRRIADFVQDRWRHLQLTTETVRFLSGREESAAPATTGSGDGQAPALPEEDEIPF